MSLEQLPPEQNYRHHIDIFSEGDHHRQPDQQGRQRGDRQGHGRPPGQPLQHRARPQHPQVPGHDRRRLRLPLLLGGELCRGADDPVQVRDRPGVSPGAPVRLLGRQHDLGTS